MRFSEAQLLALVASFFWPLLRIGGMFATLPIFRSRSVPVRVRVVLSVAITLAVMPSLPVMPAMPLFGYETLMIGAQQLLIGILTGFILQLVFEAVIIGGQTIAFSMGLGFASMIDPQTGIQVPIVAQLYSLFTTLVFLGMDGHLLLIELLVESFRTLPISTQGIAPIGFWQLIQWGSRIFAGGFLFALPVLSALLLVNLGFGVATRAVPQLNIFSVGFMISILFGWILILLTLPHVLSWFAGFLSEAYRLITGILST